MLQIAALWSEKAQGGAGASLVPPLQQGGTHYTHGILNETGREPDTASELQCCFFPSRLSLFDLTIGQVLPVTRGVRGCTVRPGAECILLGTRQSKTEQEWGLCTGLCLLGLGGFLLRIFSSQTQSRIQLNTSHPAPETGTKHQSFDIALTASGGCGFTSLQH